MELNAARPVVFVSDAHHPTGAAIVHRLRRDGFRVAANVRGAVTETSEVPGSECLATANPLDTSRAVERALEDVLRAFGRLDALIWNPDNPAPLRVEDGSLAQFDQQLTVHAKGAFLLTQAAGRIMERQGTGGALVYVGSIHDEKPTGVAFAYAAAEGALKMLSREAALDLGRRGIRVNLVEVGPLGETGQRFLSDVSDAYADYDRKIPLPTVGTPDDVAGVVSFLLGPDARFLNGAEIRLDGGFTLHYMDHKMRSSP